MAKSLYAVIMAAGSGSRMGGELPKQFLDLGGKPVLRLTIERFVAAVPDVRIVTVLPRDFVQYWREYCAADNFTCRQTLVEGGITRFHSVRNALAHVPDGHVVAIHDGVRPFVTVEMIRGMLERMEDCRAAVPVVPCVDTIVLMDNGFGSAATPLDRTKVYAVQTPQMFLSEDIKRAYGMAYDTSFTDDSGVAARFGIPVSYVEGDRGNVKLTAPRDLEIARALISVQRR